MNYSVGNSEVNCVTNCCRHFVYNKRNVLQRVDDYLVCQDDLSSNCRTIWFFRRVANYRNNFFRPTNSHRHYLRFANTLVRMKVCHWNFFAGFVQAVRRYYYGWLYTAFTNFVHKGYAWVEPNGHSFNHYKYVRVIVYHFPLNSIVYFLNVLRHCCLFRSRLCT